MNERTHDQGHLLEFLNKIWAEDYFVWDASLQDERVRGDFLALRCIALPVKDRERSTSEKIDVPD